MPDWLIRAHVDRLEALRARAASIPEWARNASPAEHLGLAQAIENSWSAQNDVDKMFAGLKDAYGFAEPLLRHALKQQYGVEDDIRETFVKLYTSASRRSWSFDIVRGARSRTVSLLDAALHNFSSSETFLEGSEFITRPDARGRFAIKNTRDKMSIEQFKNLCRELDIGARYRTYLENYLLPANGLAQGVLEHRIIHSQKTALAAALQIALVKKDIGPDAYRLMQGIIQGVKGLTLDGKAVRFHHLTMMDTRLTGIVLIGPDVDARARGVRRIIAYVPHDPEHPLKEYPSADAFLSELTRQLRDVRAGQSGGPSYQQFFSRFIEHKKRGYFFADLNQRLNRVTWHEQEPGVDLPSWRATPVDHPSLHYSAIPFRDENGHHFQGNLWVYLYEEQQNKILNDARELAISTADADSDAYWAWIDNLEGMLLEVFNVALLVVTPFVPFLGELMLAYTAYQLASEVIEGVMDFSWGEYLEASDSLLSVVQSLAQLAAFGGAVAVGTQVVARLSPLIEGAQPVTLANGKQRLWTRDLRPYEHKGLGLPADSKPDAQWLHQHQGKPVLRVDERHYALQKDPHSELHRVLHPSRPEAYQPAVQSNNAGAFVIEGERPAQWDERTLMARLGPSVEGLGDSFDDLRLISDASVQALRRMYLNNEPPLPLLSDTVTRLRIDQQVQAFITQLASERPEQFLQADALMQLQLLDGLWPAETRVQLIARDGQTVRGEIGSADVPAQRIYEDSLVENDVLRTLLTHLDEGQTQHLMERELGATVTTNQHHAQLLRAELARRARRRRTELFERRYAEHEARWGARVQTVCAHVPGLPGVVAAELLELASAEELQALSQDYLPPRLKGLASYALDEVRVARAYEGVYLSSVESFDTDKLVLHSLENLPGWPADIRIEVRHYERDGWLMDRIGGADARLTRTIVAEADQRFTVCDEQGNTLGVTADFHEAILRALPPAELRGLNLRADEVQGFKSAVREHLLAREQLPGILGRHPAPPPPAYDPRLLRLRGGAPVQVLDSLQQSWDNLLFYAYGGAPVPAEVRANYLDGLGLIHERFSIQGFYALEWSFHDLAGNPLALAQLRQSVELLPDLNRLLSPESFFELLDEMFEQQPMPLSSDTREWAMTARYLEKTGRAEEYAAWRQGATTGEPAVNASADLYHYASVIGETPPAVGKVIAVEPQVMVNLQQAQRAITRSKELLPLSGNQLPSIWEKGGSAIAKLKHLRKVDLVTGLPTAELSIAEAAQAAIEIKGGNCSENSKVTFSILASEPRTAAIHIVRASDFDHQYVVIGDLSQPEQLVVADSWPEFPVAHLSSEGYFSFDPEPVVSLDPGPAIDAYRFIDDAPPGPASTPPRGSDDTVLRAIKIPKLHLKGGYVQWTSLKELGVAYAEPGQPQVSFERLDMALIERRIEAYEHYFAAIKPV
ncbi:MULTISPECIES: dermonecrotic toxin domain-containing protein [unclassified Pseudomonas]|uniref:dermonecrotic toxin domain-containing protein n=1 Tax=unclassified Pseudomonas TaxID=196821 RepID=UPI002115147D|nr:MULTISPECIES: DUF6543 domain-containing protein [unclassified Pseudomonas]